MSNFKQYFIIILIIALVAGIGGSLVYRHFVSEQRTKKLEQLAMDNQWDYYREYIVDDDEAPEQLKELYDIANEVIMQNNNFYEEYKFQSIIKGKFQNTDFWYVFIKASREYYDTRNEEYKTDINTNSIFITKTQTPVKHLVIMPYLSSYKLLDIEYLSNLGGFPLYKVPNYDWLLVSNKEVFNNLLLNSKNLKKLKDILTEEIVVTFGKNYISLTVNKSLILQTDDFQKYLSDLAFLKNKVF